MKRAAAALLLAVSCTTADVPAPVPVSPTAARDPRFDELQVALTELLERVDVLNARLEQLEDTRERGVAPAASTPSATSDAAPSPAPAGAATAAATGAAREEPQRALLGADLADAYRAAIESYARGRHAEARAAFLRVFEGDPNGDLADNALYWIGECHAAEGALNEAMRYYARVVAEYPDQNKAPDALLKQGLAIAKTGDLALARRTLRQVRERYPFSSAAATADRELERIRF